MTLDATGLSIPSQADIIAAINASIIADIGAQVQLDSDSVTGRIVTIISSQISEAYELLRAIYDAMSPDQAEGAWLDLVAALVLVARDDAVSSFADLTFVGTPATIIPLGSIYRVPDGASFLTTEAAVIPGGGTIDIPIESQIAGAIEAGAGTITEPVSIIAGVTSVTNAAAVTVGRPIETDESLRQKREASLSRPGGRTSGSIRAALLALDTVTQALVLSNDGDTIDSDGLPPHSFRAVIWPVQADDDPVWLAIWQTAPAAIFSDGTTAGTITDSQDVEQDVAYSLADEQVLYIDVEVEVDPQTYGGDDAVAQAVIAWGAGNDYLSSTLTSADLPLGEDVLIHEIEASISNLVTGLITIVVTAKIGIAPDPSDTENIAIDLDAIATIADANIDVTSS